jgi:hypothetical protein
VGEVRVLQIATGIENDHDGNAPLPNSDAHRAQQHLRQLLGLVDELDVMAAAVDQVKVARTTAAGANSELPS